MSITIENEIPKHRKKTDSSVSKSKNKSKHKHEYVDCLLIHNNHPHKATYCRICGKIGDLNFFETERVGGCLWRQLDRDEVFVRYKDLEQVYVDDIFQKYIPIGE